MNGNNMVWQKHAWSEDTDGLLSKELQLRSGMPTTRKDGTSPLQPGDIWVDSDEMPYPAIYVWENKWVKRDNADQSSANGVVFGHYSYDAPYDDAERKCKHSYNSCKCSKPRTIPRKHFSSKHGLLNIQR